MAAPATPRHTVRSLLRDELLDAAAAQTTESGWGRVRMAGVAAAAGVSRQTVYNEFGSKGGLAEALIAREATRFLAEVRAELDRHEDVVAALGHAAAFALRHAEATPLVKAALVPGDANELLPLLTTRADPVVGAATTVILDYLAERGTDLGLTPAQLRTAVESLVRLVISHIVLPGPSIDAAGQELRWLIRRVADGGAV